MENRYYIEITLKSDFNVLIETLTRMGVVSGNKVFQTCHLLHNNEKYYLVHFKELFSLYSFKNENKVEISKIHMDENDFLRRNSIIFLLKNWNLIELNDKIDNYISEDKGNIKVNVIAYKDKENYEFISKFQLGSKS